MTHFDGVTAVPGGFNLATISSAEQSSMAFVPVTDRPRAFGQATWYPIPVAASSLCAGLAGCSMVTANTVYQNNVMGLFARSGVPRTYLATVPTP